MFSRVFTTIFSGFVAQMILAEPWRLHDTLGLPGWLRLSGEQRTRYETLDGQFRAGGTGGDQALALRTLVAAEIRTRPVGLFAEILDARQYLSDSGSPIDNTMVNALDVLQAHVLWDAGELVPGGRSTVRLGRETLDLGSRRLVARNAYRNTINAFTGADWLWTTQSGGSVRAFWLLPVRRLPEDAASLLDNGIAADSQGLGQQFWGFDAVSPRLAGGFRAEVYLLELYEDAAPTSQRRRLHTPGLRLYRDAKPGAWDAEFEAALQRGSSRTEEGAGPVLDHSAYLVHGTVGYTFDTPWTPRLAGRYDQASGDRDPSDGANQGFDRLFGARRFEFGPTGLYGMIPRSNIRTPEYSLAVHPFRRFEAMASHRFVWLDAARDAFTAAGVRDTSGRSGTYVGQQVETRFRWEAVPGNLRFDTGVTWFLRGSFLENAPNARRQGDTTYAYFEATLLF